MSNDEERIEILEIKVNTLMEEIKKLEENQKINMAFKPPRKRVEEHKMYYYIDDEYELNASSEWNGKTDNNRFIYHNYFVNEEDAEKYLRVLNTEMKLRQLAEELNNGEEIDWEDKEDKEQIKYALCYDYSSKMIDWVQAYQLRMPRIVYCLDEDFKDKAISKIGEEALKEYLTYEF